MTADSAAIVPHRAALPVDTAQRPSFDPCIVIPFYRHEHAIAALVARLRPFGLPTYLVDDGSGEQSASVLDALAHAESAWLKLLTPFVRSMGLTLAAGIVLVFVLAVWPGPRPGEEGTASRGS